MSSSQPTRIAPTDIAAILAIGLLQPAASPDRTTAALARVGTERAAGLLARHKVVRLAGPVAARRAGEDAEHAGAYADLAANLAGLLGPADTRMATADAVLATLGATGTKFWLMKGFAARAAYPPGLPRDVGDLDVLVEHFDDAWALAAPLRRAGYEYWRGELPWFKRDVLNGAFYGQIRLVVPDRTRISVDIHAGPYSVRHCARMPLPCSFQAPAGGPVPPEENLCCVIGNAAGDCFVDAKTMNDVVLALRPELDVAHVRALLGTGHLLPFLRAVLDRVTELCTLDDDQRGVAEALAAPAPGQPAVTEPAPPLDSPDPEHRLERTVIHAGWAASDYTAATGVSAATIVASAEAAYGRELPLTVSMEQLDGRLPALNNWTCVRLVPAGLVSAGASRTAEVAGAQPASSTLSDAMTVRSFDEGDLITAPETFLPTVDFRIPIGLAARAVAYDNLMPTTAE